MNDFTELPLTSNHWGTYRVETKDGKVVNLHPFEHDADPSPIGPGIVDVLDGPTRIKAPMIRKSWLEHGPGSVTDKRGKDSFVQVSWDVAEKLVADELNRVRNNFGNNAIYAGSYGWSSAGRFHHAQSQLRRFMNTIGGFTYSINTYSLAAGEVIVPHVVGSFSKLLYAQTSWQSIIENTELFVAFGGLPVKNGQISQGGVGSHGQRKAMLEAKAAGMNFVNVSPIRSDAIDEINAQWLAPRPSTDSAILLGLMHTLLVEDLHDKEFLNRYCVGFDKFAAYLKGETDGVEKTAQWASEISELKADDLKNLARRIASSRTMVSASWSLTRQDHGEHPFWGTIVLAAMLGQIGLPGGGFGLGYSAVNGVGLGTSPFKFRALPQGKNEVADFIPVARVTELLENPGGQFEYDGKTLTYPDTKIVYWAGGNPFHHHQDLNRMVKAWQKPDTIIANEWCWNAMSKHADIVLPCTTTLEREDIAMTPRDPYVVWMEKVAEPAGDARNDFDIFKGISRQMDLEEKFTEGRTAEDWQRWMYDESRAQATDAGVEIETFDELKNKKWFKVDEPEKPRVLFEAFRSDPEAHPLNTPSGKIEIYSNEIADYGYEDCPPHPAWLEPLEWLGSKTDGKNTGNLSKHPLHLVSNQPKTKLHSHLDHGSVSREAKIKGREPVTLNPKDADARNIKPNDIVKVFNDRGACYCGVIISEDIRPGVIQISTGAWFDPDETGTLCKHGNPNVLTPDKGTSSLAQGPIAHTCLVEVEKAKEPLPEVTAYLPPVIERDKS